MRNQLHKKQKAIELRLQGKSYNEIRKILNIPSKGTLSYWFKNLELPLEAKKKLNKNIEFARKHGLFRFNKNRTKIIKSENQQIRLSAAKSIPKLSSKDLFLIGIALYWGEGNQNEKNKKNLVMGFTNSNPYMIALFLRFTREILKINNDRIKPHLRIYPNIDKNMAINFWSKTTNLPKKNFCVTNQISISSKQKRPFNALPYGTLDLRINNRRLFFKIKGCIDGLAAQSGLKFKI